MTRKALTLLLGYTAVLTFACASALAGSADPRKDGGVIVFRGMPTWVMATTPSPFIVPAVVPDATNLYTIYSNLGPPHKVYYYTAGSAVTGPSTSYGQIWLAMPFTPKSNAKVTQIAAAIEYTFVGANGVTMSLNEDSGGLPGNALRTWNLKNLPNLGTCCRLDRVNLPKSVTVKKGTQYWVVAKTNKSTENTVDAWDNTYNLVLGPYAANIGSGWRYGQTYIGAFAVFGKKVQ